MNKRIKALCIGGAVLLVLGGALTALLLLPNGEGGGEDTSSSSTASQIALIEKQTTDVKSVHIKNTQDEYTIEKNAEDTWIIAGIEDLPRENNVYSYVVSTVAKLSAKQLVEENPTQQQMKDYGLAEPLSVVTVTFTDGTEKVIEVGALEPNQTGPYMKLAGENTVYLGSGDAKKYFFYTKNNYISTSVIEELDSEEEITYQKIVIDGNKVEQPITIVKNEDTSEEPGVTEYIITQPIQAYIDTSYTQKLFNCFSGVYALEATVLHPTPQQLAEYGLDNPSARLKLTSNKLNYTLELGNSDGDYMYLRKEGVDVIYKVSSASLLWKDITLYDVHTKMLFTPHIDNVRTITVSSGESKNVFTLEGTGDATKVSGDGKELDVANFRKYYQFIIECKAEEKADPISSQTPLATITFTFKDESKQPLVVTFYPSSSRKAVISIGGDYSFQTRSAFVDKLLENTKKVLNGESVSVTW